MNMQSDNGELRRNYIMNICVGCDSRKVLVNNNNEHE